MIGLTSNLFDQDHSNQSLERKTGLWMQHRHLAICFPEVPLQSKVQKSTADAMIKAPKLRTIPESK